MLNSSFGWRTVGKDEYYFLADSLPSKIRFIQIDIDIKREDSPCVAD